MTAAAADDDLAFDRDQAAAFLRTRWTTRRGRAIVAFGCDGARDAHGAYTHQRWNEKPYQWPDDEVRLLDDVERALAAGRVDVYVCPHLRAETGPRRKGGALPPNGLHADVDRAPNGAARALLERLDPIRVGSGGAGHEHAHVLLGRGVDLATWDRLQRAFRDHLGGAADAKIADNDVLRLPGTFNFKSDPPAPVRLITTAAAVWDVDELAALLGIDLSATGPAPRAAGVAPSHTAAEPAPAHLPPLVRARLEAPAPDRSAATYALIGACRTSELTLGQTHSIVAGYGPAVEKYHRPGQLAEEVERSWSKVDPPVELPRARMLTPGTGAVLEPPAAPAVVALPTGLARFLLPATVWEHSPFLAHIYRAAMARLVSPDVLLHAVFAVVASLLHHDSRVLTGKGASPLNHFVAPVGASGAGKSQAVSVARELLAEWVDARFAITGGDGYVDAPLGSGEGLIEAFMGEEVRDQLDHDGSPLLDRAGQVRTERVRAQVRHNALFTADEGRQVLAIDNRKGATVLAVLCEMWSGATAGQTNAEASRTRKLTEGSYVVGLIAGFQVVTIDALFADEAGGTPQRFAFAPAEYAPFGDDLDADDEEWPGELVLDVPVTAVTVALAPEQQREVRRAIRAKAAGRSTDGALDGHRTLIRCRVAGLLALLHGTHTVTDELWDLAKVLTDRSCNLRDWLAEQGRRKATEQRQDRRKDAVATAVEVQARTAMNERIVRAASQIARAVERAGGSLTRGRALNGIRADLRDVREDALDHALRVNLVEMTADGRTVELAGRDGHRDE